MACGPAQEAYSCEGSRGMAPRSRTPGSEGVLLPLVLVEKRSSVARSRMLEQAGNKVFLLLFLQKKKILLF